MSGKVFYGRTAGLCRDLGCRSLTDKLVGLSTWRQGTEDGIPIEDINVTSFSSISYYSNVRLISKIELEQNFHSIILDIHASANERPSHLFCFKLRTMNKYSRFELN